MVNNKKVYGYLGNQLGFSETGRHVLNTLIIPKLTKMGIKVLDPFIEVAKRLKLGPIDTSARYDEVMRNLKERNNKTGIINAELMQKADVFLAILDGGHTVDEGVASEIVDYSLSGRGPIIALRSDSRLVENIAAPINAQLLHYIEKSGGKLIEPPNALERWFAAVKEWYDSFTK